LSELEAPPVSAARPAALSPARAVLAASTPSFAFFWWLPLFALAASVFSGVASPSIPIVPSLQNVSGFAF